MGEFKCVKDMLLALEQFESEHYGGPERRHAQGIGGGHSLEQFPVAGLRDGALGHSRSRAPRRRPGRAHAQTTGAGPTSEARKNTPNTGRLLAIFCGRSGAAAARFWSSQQAPDVRVRRRIVVQVVAAGNMGPADF
jgi:hypothetical protein